VPFIGTEKMQKKLKQTQTTEIPTTTWLNRSAELTVLTLIAAVLALRYFTLSGDQNKYFNADALMIYSFWRDILFDHGHFSAWHFSNAPSFVPDFLIAFGASLFSKDIYYQIFFSALIQVGLFYAIIRRLARPFMSTSNARYAMFIMLVLVYWATKDISPYLQILILNWHFGTYLAGLYYLSVVFDCVDNLTLSPHSFNIRRYASLTLLLSLLSFSITVSDILFIVLFSAPLFVLSLYWATVKKLSWAAFALLFALPFSVGLLAKFLAPIIVPHHGGVSLHILSWQE